MELAGKKVFVTGATGLLRGGRCRRLLEEGAEVVGLARSAERARGLVGRGTTIVGGDLSQPSSDAMAAAMRGCSVVLHCAGVMGPDFGRPRSYFQTVNVEGTRWVAKAALAAKVERFVYVSSVWVYGFDAGPGTNELSPRHPSGDSYCDTKLEAENLIRSFVTDRGLPAVIVQPTEVYGPRDRSWTLIPLRMIKSGQMMLPGGGKGVIQPVFVDDVVEGILAAAKRGAVGEAYMLSGPTVVSCSEFFGYHAEMAGRSTICSVPSWLAGVLALTMTGVSRIAGRPPLFPARLFGGSACRLPMTGEKPGENWALRPVPISRRA